MPPEGPIALIVNAHARRGEVWFEDAKSKLAEAGVELSRVVLLGKNQSLETEVKSALAEGCRAILVGGGDGTLSAAAKLVARSDAVLGVLPLGTGNAFARDLGIKTDIDIAVKVIAGGFVGQVDLGRAGDKVFLNVASLGLSTLIASKLSKAPKALLGPLAYVVPLLQAVRIIRPFRARLTFEDGIDEIRVYQIVVGNGRFHAGPFPLDEHARIDSGEFLIYAVGAEDRRVLFRYLLAVLWGRQTELPEVQVWRRTKVQIETWPTRKVVLDGEIALQTPCRFEVVPKGLSVFMPNPPGE